MTNDESTSHSWLFVLRHSVDVSNRQRERIFQDLDPRFRPFRNDHLHHIEPEQNVGIAQQSQPGQPAAGNPNPLLAIDGLQRPPEILARSRFYFDEHQRVALAADHVDFAAGARLEITRQNFVAVLPQESAGQVLPVRAKTKMRGTRSRKAAAPPVRKIVDESDKARVHAVLSGAIPCRSLCAG